MRVASVMRSLQEIDDDEVYHVVNHARLDIPLPAELAGFPVFKPPSIAIAKSVECAAGDGFFIRNVPTTVDNVEESHDAGLGLEIVGHVHFAPLSWLAGLLCFTRFVRSLEFSIARIQAFSSLNFA